MNTLTNERSVTILTERQAALIQLIQELDPDHRHTITVSCRGSEPWTVERIVEHQRIDLKPTPGKR